MTLWHFGVFLLWGSRWWEPPRRGHARAEVRVELRFLGDPTNDAQNSFVDPAKLDQVKRERIDSRSRVDNDTKKRWSLQNTKVSFVKFEIVNLENWGFESIREHRSISCRFMHYFLSCRSVKNMKNDIWVSLMCLPAFIRSVDDFRRRLICPICVQCLFRRMSHKSNLTRGILINNNNVSEARGHRESMARSP